MAAGFAREIGPGRGFLQQANLVPDYYQTFSNDLGAGVTEGASPVTHPYIDTSGVLAIQPNQQISLTLLVEPQTEVHATSGLLPEAIGMRRNWVAAGLAALSPTFRFGPVLVDPQKIRMPVSTDIQGAWSWDHRTDVITWAEDPVVNETADAQLRPDPAAAEEGWLRLTPEDRFHERPGPVPQQRQRGRVRGCPGGAAGPGRGRDSQRPAVADAPSGNWT